MLRDLADQGHLLQPDLIRRQDFPPRDYYLPRPLPLEEDQRLQQQLRLTDTLEANALRLMRATGIRIGECIALPIDCLQAINEKQGPCMCLWVSSIRKAWYRSRKKQSVSWHAWWSCAPKPRWSLGGGECPLASTSPKFSHYLATATLATGKIVSVTA